MPFNKTADAHRHAEPLSLVHYFYTKLYPGQSVEQTIFSDKETAFAQSLLASYTFSELHDLIDYTIEAAGHSHAVCDPHLWRSAQLHPTLARRARHARRSTAASARGGFGGT
jgi:hypothetical protein